MSLREVEQPQKKKGGEFENSFKKGQKKARKHRKQDRKRVSRRKPHVFREEMWRWQTTRLKKETGRREHRIFDGGRERYDVVKTRQIDYRGGKS